MTYSVAAENMSVEDLSWFVDDTVTKRLSDIPGVSSVGRVGGLQREITVAADPIALSGLKFFYHAVIKSNCRNSARQLRR